MLIKEAEALAMARKAVEERTTEVASEEGREREDWALSTILIWMVWPAMQVRGAAALMHLTSYSLPHAAPLSHIPSPADPNMLLDGNCDASPPKHAVAVYKLNYQLRVIFPSMDIHWNHVGMGMALTEKWRAVPGGGADVGVGGVDEEGWEEEIADEGNGNVWHY